LHRINIFGIQVGGSSELEVDKLREEVEILRSELHRAEVELEDRCWVAPIILQVK
jgi:stromal interaction molecule 1